MNECFTSLNFSTARPEITTAFQALPPLDAEIIYLRHHRELTNEEAAGILEVAPGVASRLYVRALRRLKERITQQESAFTPFGTGGLLSQFSADTRVAAH